LLAGCGTTLPPPPSSTSAAQPSSSLPAPKAARNWDEFKRQAARRMVEANPGITYTGPVPEPLLAIPVLEVELNADGSVRNITVLRHPRQAKDTTDIAIAAVRRGAPYGDMRHLKKPWKFSEVFLFDDSRRFKPRTLDE
jgi:protein TonB